VNIGGEMLLDGSRFPFASIDIISFVSMMKRE
jgi:hypothetical protein